MSQLPPSDVPDDRTEQVSKAIDIIRQNRTDLANYNDKLDALRLVRANHFEKVPGMLVFEIPELFHPEARYNEDGKVITERMVQIWVDREGWGTSTASAGGVSWLILTTPTMENQNPIILSVGIAGFPYVPAATDRATEHWWASNPQLKERRNEMLFFGALNEVAKKSHTQVRFEVSQYVRGWTSRFPQYGYQFCSNNPSYDLGVIENVSQHDKGINFDTDGRWNQTPFNPNSYYRTTIDSAIEKVPSLEASFRDAGFSVDPRQDLDKKMATLMGFSPLPIVCPHSTFYNVLYDALTYNMIYGWDLEKFAITQSHIAIKYGLATAFEIQQQQTNHRYVDLQRTVQHIYLRETAGLDFFRSVLCPTSRVIAKLEFDAAKSSPVKKRVGLNNIYGLFKKEIIKYCTDNKENIAPASKVLISSDQTASYDTEYPPISSTSSTSTSMRSLLTKSDDRRIFRETSAITATSTNTGSP